jgi:acetyltransferase-like isoleucine patch superfamily enzyme
MNAGAHDWYPLPIPGNVRLGARSWLETSFAFLHHHSRREPSVVVGSDSGIHAPCHFDLGLDAEVRIGSFCSITGTFISTAERVTIGDYTFIGFGTVLADRADAVPPPSRDRLSPSEDQDRGITIGDNVWIGTRAIILGGTEVGADAVVGAGAVLAGTRVPEGAIVAGNPARIVGSTP